VLLVAPTAGAAPMTLTADVEYDFIDQNGMGWAKTGGKVTVRITFSGTGGSLSITGKRESFDGRLVEAKPPRPSPDLTGDKWEGKVTESYPLHDVVVTSRAIAFKLDPVHDHLTGSCTPTKVAELTSATLYECTISGFQWHTIPHLPELHHPILFDADTTAKLRVLNSVTGKTKAGFGHRRVSLVKPALPQKSTPKP
jgi:hypothetical protein